MRMACCGKRIYCFMVMLLLGISFMYSHSLAGPPPILNYQGTLTDDQGNPANGQKTMSFRIYNSATAAPGQALWESGDVLVTVVKGVFSVNLGEAPQKPIPAGLFSASTRYLGVTVDGSELADKKRLVSVPYALNADSGIPKGVIVMWSGIVDDVPPGWAVCDGQNGTPDLRDRFILGAGSNYPVGTPPGGSSIINLAHGHSVNAHSHSISADGNHAHSGSTGTPSSIGSVCKERDDNERAQKDHTHPFTTDAQGTHSHGWATGAAGSDTDSQLSSSQSILPPYYVLCFIIKL